MERNQKHSHKREAILACLCATDTHPTADGIFETLSRQEQEISRATVYRNLAKFRADGQIVTVANVDGFERFDANTAPHPHFICRRCHAVQDVCTPSLSPALCTDAAAALDAEIDSAWITFYGLCANCRYQRGEKDFSPR